MSPSPDGDLIAKVTGAARYASDIGMDGMLHAALVRSTVAHGRILSIDTSEAESMPGVHCVVTAKDFGDVDPFYGELVNDQPMLAIDRVRFIGDPICAVVARTRAEAVAATKFVEVDIEPLPELLRPEDALADDAQPIHPDFPSHSPDAPNVCREATLDVGDVDTAFAGAAWVHHAVYTCPAVYHYAMEPHCSIASWEGNRLSVVSGTQQPFRVRDTLARMFGLPTSRISVRSPYVGGAYGSKGETKYEPVVAMMSRVAGRPVKLLISVEEAIHTITRHACRVEMWTAIDESGAMTGRRSEVEFDTGAYADKGPRIAMRGALRVSGPYRIPNLKVRSRAVYTNKVPAGAYRGFSTSQVLWASESAMDEIAHQLGVDPVEYRLRHVIRGDDLYAGIDPPVDSDLAYSVTTAIEALGPDQAHGANVGRAMALGVKDGGGGAAHAAAIMHLYPDGSVEVRAGGTELGQGAHGVLGTIAADILGIPSDRVEVRLGDTDSAPFDRGTNASRTTVGIGSAVEDAARQIKAKIAEAWRVAGRAGDSPVLDGGFVVDGTERVRISELFAEAYALPAREFPGVIVTGNDVSEPEPGTTHFPTMFYEIGTTAVEVAVDTDTGQIDLRRLVSLIEAGKALSLQGTHGQNVGAAMMGIGTTFSEGLIYEGGELQNANMIEYRVPTMASFPHQGIESLLIENGDGPGPQGAKGLGEAGIIVVAPAIANAVEMAVGVRLRALPLTPESVWRALQERDDAAATTASPDSTDREV